MIQVPFEKGRDQVAYLKRLAREESLLPDGAEPSIYLSTARARLVEQLRLLNNLAKRKGDNLPASVLSRIFYLGNEVAAEANRSLRALVTLERDDVIGSRLLRREPREIAA